MSDIEPKLLAFLAGQFALRGYQLCVKVELEYSPPGGYRADPLQTWTPESHPEVFGVLPPPEGQTESEDEAKAKQLERRHLFTQRLVGEMVELAGNFADSYGQGTHPFTVRTHQTMGGRATHRFALKPSYRGEMADDVPPEAMGQGVTAREAQLMRHLENKERGMREMLGTFLQTMRHNFDGLRDENDSLRQQIKDHQDWRQKTLEAIEEARSKEHDRELELAIVMGERERKDFAVKKVVNLLPVAVSAAIRKLGPGSDNGKGANGTKTKAAPPSPLAEALGKLAMTITEEQKAQLQVTLSMQQVLSLQEAIEVSLEGGSILLPTLVGDLIQSITPGQLSVLMGMFTPAQQVAFVQVLQLAKASKDLVREAEEPQAVDKTEAAQPEAQS